MKPSDFSKQNHHKPSEPFPIRPVLIYTCPALAYAAIGLIQWQVPLSALAAWTAAALTIGFLLMKIQSHIRHEIRVNIDLTAVMAGILVFMIWVGLDGYYPLNPLIPHISAVTGPDIHPPSWELVGVRLFTSAVILPVMTELFWRSFALRFLINSRFNTIPLGSFSWISFLAVNMLYGVCHERWLPGIIAGAIYSILLYQRKNLFSPILANGTTQALLGIYTVSTGSWTLWSDFWSSLVIFFGETVFIPSTITWWT
ncbi:MAG: CAAX prenyl protease-related protein [Desulfobacteraceae bacterium]|nr:MAG: CAAX prenyl protease-related protein [Desulfobacteraceae bacterium]